MQPSQTDPSHYAFARQQQQQQPIAGPSSAPASRSGSGIAQTPLAQSFGGHMPYYGTSGAPSFQTAQPGQLPLAQQHMHYSVGLPAQYHIPDSPLQQSQATTPRSGASSPQTLTRSRRRTAASAAPEPADAQDEAIEEDWQPDDEEGDSAAGGRALKNTRRAVQNRLAQRAFRERKENHMKDLQEKTEGVKQLRASMQAAEVRRLEVEARAKALAERAMALDAHEQALAIRNKDGIVDDPPTPPQPIRSPPPTLPQEAVPHWQQAQVELMQLRREIAERDIINAALRRAYEEMSQVNRQLREAGGTQQTEAAPPTTEQTKQEATEAGQEPDETH